MILGNGVSGKARLHAVVRLRTVVADLPVAGDGGGGAVDQVVVDLGEVDRGEGAGAEEDPHLPLDGGVGRVEHQVVAAHAERVARAGDAGGAHLDGAPPGGAGAPVAHQVLVDHRAHAAVG